MFSVFLSSYRNTRDRVKSRKLWKHSPAPRVPKAFLLLPNFHSCLYLTNRFHVAVHLSSNRSQMTSKCGKDRKVAHEAIAECVTDVLTTFDVLCDLLLDRCTATWNLFVLYNKEFNFVRIKAALFHVRRAKMGAPHFEKHEKSHLASSMIYTK